jgi:hypothetical protein
MSEEFGIEDGYTKIMNIDSLLIQEMNRMSIYRVNDPKQFCSAIEGFIEDCEDKIREKAFAKQEELGLKRCGYISIPVTDEMFRLYCELKVYTYQLLEKKGKIFRSKNIKTYG